MMKRYHFILFVTIYCLLKSACGMEDRSIAMVGNKIIWDNDVKERAQVRGLSYEKALLDLIEEKLLIVQAKKENIPVSKEEIDNRFNFIVEEWKKNGHDFVKFIKDNGLTVDQYKDILAEDIQKEKLVNQEIIDKVKVSPFEIAKRMALMPEEKQVILLKKEFDDDTFAESFISKLKDNKKFLQQMQSTDWISVNKLDSTLLSELYSAGKGNPVVKKISGKTFVYILAEERENTPQDRYKRAYQEIRQEKIVKSYSDYLNNLTRSIPVKIFDENISKKISIPAFQ